MRSVALIVGRELGYYFRGWSGYIIAAAFLLLNGVLFQAWGMDGERLSSGVLSNFFYLMFGTMGTAGIFLSMRVLAEERHDGTLVLLFTAPISDWQIVLGKWLSAWIFLALIVAASFYMPLMVAMNGSVHPGQIAAGYLGVLLIGGVTTALGTFASSLTQSQIVAGIVAGSLVLRLIRMYLLSSVVEPPFDNVFAYMALFDKHYAFRNGTINTRSVVYYLSLMLFFLLLARHSLSARRWR